ncbi:MAG: efflux RND transporter periplasmic adaptor subunit [Phycisphaerales bacterium]
MAGASDSPFVLRLASYILKGGLGFVVLAGGVGVFAFLVGTKPDPAQAPRHDHVVTVRAVEVRPMPVPRVWEGYGTARAMRSADVAAQVAARVVERPVGIEAGVTLAAGDVIVRLDPVDFEQRVAASQALIVSWEAQLAGLDVDERRLGGQLEIMHEEIRLEEREVERVASAVELRGANDIEVERRRKELARRQRERAALQQLAELIPPRRAQVGAQIANERANLRLAQENLERATVRAPIGGVLQEVFAQPGEMMSVGALVARIVDLSRVEVPLRLPVSAADLLRAGDAVDLGPDSPGSGGTGARWRGRVVRIAPEADAQSRTITVYVEVAQQPGVAGSVRHGLLLPGQFVAGTVTTAADQPRIAVPRIAVNGDRVMIAQDGEGGSRAKAVTVSVLFHARGAISDIDPTETEWAVLASGLSGGERVITTNLDELRDGTSVRIEAAGPVAAESGGGGAAAPGSGGGGP